MSRKLSRNDYTVGWVSALPVELAAAQEMLDEQHESTLVNTDENLYTLGSIGGHNVVIACLPGGRIGNNPAATVAMQMKASFQGIRFVLMVGIGGGVPSAEADVRLGDVVVSQPSKVFGGVVQYDIGKSTPSGFERTGSLNSPPHILLAAVAQIQANELRNRSRISNHLSKLQRIAKFQRNKTGPDILFEATYDHQGGQTCRQCSSERQKTREPRENDEIVVHYGTIASGNRVMRDASQRDEVSKELDGVLCFEMEAAGLMNNFPCIVIRGICDYADSHKNNRWQAYASGTAAAYAKELLCSVPAAYTMTHHWAEEAKNDRNKRSSQPLPPDRASSKRRKVDTTDGLESDIAEERQVIVPIYSESRDRTSWNDEQRENLLQSLRFEQIDVRQMTIKSAHAKTCKWLLRNPRYLDWLDRTKLDEHHGFLWIKGKAGAGKSTLMKFAMMNARKTMRDRTTLAFFFNARGEEMERTTTGTYRSLLLQLLERVPTLQSALTTFDLPLPDFNSEYSWSIEWLKMLLEHIIQALGETSVLCFIDALDECEEEQVRDMIQFLERIGDIAVTAGICFQVCFSSRHYPHITIRNGLELVLEGQEGHAQDIANYVDTQLKIGKSKTAQQLRVELQEKASGIFMWVVLVVGILNKASDCGHAHTLRRKLHEIPGDLHALFHDILTRDSHNKDQLVLCIQWVLFSKQALSPEQLYCAILSGTDPSAVSEWDSEDITQDVVRRFILNSSKGLAEATVSKEPKVQFIHESVRDFLLKENGLGKIWPEFNTNFLGQSHERLKQCCRNYIYIDVATTLELPDDPPKLRSQHLAAAIRKKAAQKFPFLEYAVRNVFHHADEAEGSGISQTLFLAMFSLPQWVKLDNMLEKHDIRRHTESVSRSYIYAELNTANLLRISSAERCMTVEKERYGCPLFAAGAMGNQEALEVCLRSVGKSGVGDNALHVIEKHASNNQRRLTGRRDFVYSKTKDFLWNAADLGNDEILTCLLESNRFEIDSTDSKGRSLLWWAATRGCVATVRLLLRSGAKANGLDRNSSSALKQAVFFGHKEIVELLLDSDAHIDVRCETFNEVFHVACGKGHVDIVSKLLYKGANVNARGEAAETALQAVVRMERSSLELVKVLLDGGADVNAPHGQYGNALYMAVRLRREKDILELLLNNDADVNARGGEYGNALQAAVACRKNDVVELLLKWGADVNAKGGNYGYALQAAASIGNTNNIKLLLDRGANVNAHGGMFGSALQAAAYTGITNNIKLLLDRGANVNARGGKHGSALQAAVWSEPGKRDAVKLLLDRGADVNVRGGTYGSALQAAAAAAAASGASRASIGLVKLLLDRGADINAQGGKYESALQAAAAAGSVASCASFELVKLLLDRGADINAQGGKYGSALQAVALKSGDGKYAFVKMLIDRGADVNARGGQHGSALQAAREQGHDGIVALLLERGATDTHGGTT